MAGAVEVSQARAQGTRSRSPPSAAVRLTRSQLAKKAELDAAPEPKSLVDGLGQTPEERHEEKKEEALSAAPIHEIETSDSTSNHDVHEHSKHVTFNAPASPEASAMPKVIASLRTDTPGKRSTSNKENMEPLEPATTNPSQAESFEMVDDVAAATTPATMPPVPNRDSASRLADRITALDELDDAVENVSRDIPEIQTSPEKLEPKSKPNLATKKERQKVAPVVRTTKAAQARISMFQNKEEPAKTPSLGRPRPSATLGRASSVRQSTATRAEAATKRVLSSSTVKDAKMAASVEKKEAVIPHSKPRPVSLSFPTPPPPAKSTKAPTQSTFQLPGEAVAAKLKAAREARQQKEAEEAEKKPAFKARPVPAGLSKAPSVRQTTASKARESVMNGKDLKTSAPAPSASVKRTSSLATSRPIMAPPRDPAKRAAISAKPSTLSLEVKKRPSAVSSNASKSRSSVAAATPAPVSAAQRASSNPTKGTAKGKEVFNRAANLKAAAAAEKAEKEAAAKKARVEAAERGRQASRDWAEKQKQRKISKQTIDKKDGMPTQQADADAGEQTSAVETTLAEAPTVVAM